MSDTDGSVKSVFDQWFDRLCPLMAMQSLLCLSLHLFLAGYRQAFYVLRPLSCQCDCGQARSSCVNSLADQRFYCCYESPVMALCFRRDALDNELAGTLDTGVDDDVQGSDGTVGRDVHHQTPA